MQRNRSARFPLYAALAAGAMLAGCSGVLDKFGRTFESKPGHTNVVIGRGSSGVPMAFDTLTGGIMVYAMDPDGDGLAKSAFLASESGSVTMSLPNGSYRFYGVGWQAGGLTSAPYCGFGSSSGTPGETVTLAGETKLVQIVMTTTDCTNTEFGTADFLVAGVPVPLGIAFCASDKNINGLAVGATCSADGDESSLLLSGNSGGTITTVQQGGNGVDTGSLFLFTSTAYATGSLKELFATELSAGRNAQRRISPNMFSSPGVVDARRTSDASKAVYIASQDATGKHLYVTPTTHIAPTKLNGGVAATEVKEFFLIANDTKVAYISDEVNTGVFEIFVVNIDGTGRIKISGITPAGIGVTFDGSSRAIWDVTSDGSKIAYAAKEGDATDDRVYVASTTVANSSNQVSPAKGHAGAVVIQQLRITPDSTRVVYLGDIGVVNTTDNENEIYSSLVASPFTATVISQATETGTGNRFEMHKDQDDPTSGTGKIAYLGDVNGAGAVGRRDLAIVNADGTSQCKITDVASLGAAGASNDGVDRIYYNGSGNRLIFSRELSSAGTPDPRVRLFVVDITTCPTINTAVELTDGTAFVGAGANASYTGNGMTDIEFVDNDTRVVYLADQDNTGANNGTVELWTVTIGGTGLTKISGNVAPGAAGNVAGFRVGGSGSSTIVLKGDLDTDTNDELYTVGITGSPARVKISPALLAASAIPDFHIFSTQNKVLMQITLAGESAPIILIKNLDTNTSFEAARTHSATPLGRVRVHVLNYESNNGSLGGFSSGIASGCLVAPGTDGNVLSTSVKIPYGSATGKIPVAVGIEIFPLASSCLGASTFVFFPFGLARADFSSPTTMDTNIDGDSASAVLWIRDPVF